LKRPLNYKPYTGAIKSAIETSVSKVSQSCNNPFFFLCLLVCYLFIYFNYKKKVNQSASKENIPKS